MKNMIQYKKVEMNETQKIETKKETVLSVKLTGKSDDIGKSINCFLSGKTGKFGKYVSVENALVYRTLITDRRHDGYKTAQNIIAIRLTSGLILGNASILPLIGRSVNFGRENLNSSVSEIQTRISQVIPMLPFTVFQETGLNLSNVKIVCQGPEESVTRKIDNPKYDYQDKEKQPEFIDETVHFTGSKLFETDGVQFLFDIDRVEILNKIFNPFLVKLSVVADSIQSAYDSLKPEIVKQAEKQGLKILRQGEWFLIPSNETPENENATDKILKQDKEPKESWRRSRFELRAGRNRPNHAAYGFKIGEDSYISGKLEHSGREHAPIILKGWYKVVPNTAIESFTISGDVD